MEYKYYLTYILIIIHSFIPEYENATAGAITITPQSSTNKRFNEYITSLNPRVHGNNTWLTSYWQDYFECDLPGKTFILTGNM